MVQDIKYPFIIFSTIFTSIYNVVAIPFLLLILINVIDYITGVGASYVNGIKIEPKRGIIGIIKKVSMWLLVLVGIVGDIMLYYLSDKCGINLQVHNFISALICIWLLANEMLSVLQNLDSMGVKYPKFMEKFIEALRKEGLNDLDS